MVGAFVALTVDPAIRAAIKELQGRLRGAPGIDWWQDPSTAHVTLRFFGPLADGEDERVRDEMRAIAASAYLPPLRMDALRVTSARGGSRVRWEVAPNPELEALAARFRAMPFGRPLDGPFAPHLTIARARRSPRLALPPIDVPEAALIPMEIVLYAAVPPATQVAHDSVALPSPGRMGGS